MKMLDKIYSEDGRLKFYMIFSLWILLSFYLFGFTTTIYDLFGCLILVIHFVGFMIYKVRAK
jgi:hypothetical protein